MNSLIDAAVAAAVAIAFLKLGAANVMVSVLSIAVTATLAGTAVLVLMLGWLLWRSRRGG